MAVSVSTHMIKSEFCENTNWEWDKDKLRISFDRLGTSMHAQRLSATLLAVVPSHADGPLPQLLTAGQPIRAATILRSNKREPTLHSDHWLDREQSAARAPFLLPQLLTAGKLICAATTRVGLASEFTSVIVSLIGTDCLLHPYKGPVAAADGGRAHLCGDHC